MTDRNVYCAISTDCSMKLEAGIDDDYYTGLILTQTHTHTHTHTTIISIAVNSLVIH